MISLISCIMFASQIVVVPTGDSITVGYGGGRLQSSFNQLVGDVTVQRIACGGTNIAKYTGQQVDPCTGELRDFADDVLAEDPEAIVFMLGTNDAFNTVGDLTYFEQYQDGIENVFGRFRAAVNSSGRRPIVIVATLIPVLADPAVDQLVTELYNPWLLNVTNEYGFVSLDLNTAIQQEPNWPSLYNDGIHLWANGAEGYLWMADTVRDQTLASLAAATCRCVGDVDCDQRISITDLAVVLQMFGGGGRQGMLTSTGLWTSRI